MQPTPLYQALTRPPSWGGVPVMHWLALAVVTATTVQLSKSLVVALIVAAPLFGLIRYAAWRDPWWIETWAIRLTKTPPQRNGGHWGGNSYAPW